MVMNISSGKRQVRASDSMLMQLPTPLDCISSAQRSPPSQAPAASATPSSSVVSATSWMSRIGAAALDQPRMAGVGHIADLAHAGALERGVQPVRPIGLRGRVHVGSPASRSGGRSPSSSFSSFTGTA